MNVNHNYPLYQTVDLSFS